MDGTDMDGSKLERYIFADGVLCSEGRNKIRLLTREAIAFP